jgi:hypothetical protein
MLLASPATVLGQVTVFTALERSLRNDIMCTCSCRRSLTFCGMPNCEGEAAQMAKMREYIAQGKNREQVLAAFVADQGPSALMAPPNQGFNRTAWLFVAGARAWPWGSRSPVVRRTSATAPADGRRPRPDRAWTMSSATNRDASDAVPAWQLFALAGLLGATFVVFMSRGQSPAAILLLSLTVFAAAAVGIGALRTLTPLVDATGEHSPVGRVIGGRTRAALEREKSLTLRSIKELEFDRAMGKVSDTDFAEMAARLEPKCRPHPPIDEG